MVNLMSFLEAVYLDTDVIVLFVLRSIQSTRVTRTNGSQRSTNMSRAKKSGKDTHFTDVQTFESIFENIQI
jgi:hypothetical protein